jgi:hypothetical protein
MYLVPLALHSVPLLSQKVIDRGTQAVARGAARSVSQELDRGTQAVASLCAASN